MNERDAIVFEMNELKEQGRRDFEMYFELRKYRNHRYTELQNRLRELDERDMMVKVVKEEMKENKLPESKSKHLEVRDLELERVEGQSKLAKIPFDELVPTIENFLKKNGASGAKEIKNYIQKKYNTKWQNFTSVLNNTVKRSGKIYVNKDQKKRIYGYSEALLTVKEYRFNK